MTALETIRALYFATTRETVQRDLDEAITLMKTMASEEERERAAVFMEGLAEMRQEWGVQAPRDAGAPRAGGRARTRTRKRPPTP